MKEKASVYNVVYVKDCEMRIRQFDTATAMGKWLKKFKQNEDNWVDFTFSGQILSQPSYTEVEKSKK